MDGDLKRKPLVRVGLGRRYDSILPFEGGMVNHDSHLNEATRPLPLLSNRLSVTGPERYYAYQSIPPQFPVDPYPAD